MKIVACLKRIGLMDVVGAVTGLTTLGLGYQWLTDLLRGVHVRGSKIGPAMTYRLADAPGAYWGSMAWDFAILILLAALTAICLWAGRLFRNDKASGR